MKIPRRDFLRFGGSMAAASAFGLWPARLGAAGTDDGLIYNPWQALPTFREPRYLDAADISKLPGDQQALLTTLQGVINRREPRLYWFLSGDGTDQSWLDTIGIPNTISADPWSLFAKYRAEIAGAIVYDPNVPDTINVATSLAGLESAVIASADQASALNLQVIQDLRGRFTDKFAAYNWLLDNYWPRLNPRLLTGINPASSVLIPGLQWTTLFQETRDIRDASNKGVFTADLSGLLGGEAVYVRYQDSIPTDGWGPSVSQVTVTADGNVIASFQPGTPAEQPFLYEPDSSSLASAWRFADGNSYFIYRFAPPAGTKSLTFQTEMWNQFLVTATNTAPIQHVPFANLRDYIVATRALVFWLDPSLPSEAALFAQILGKVPPDTPYLGWFVGGHEDDGVTLCSQHAVPVGAADFFNNATVFGGARAPVHASQPPAGHTWLANKVYVTLTMSEGDNLQYDQHRMRTIWDDASRGQVPINWSISPLLLDAAPAMLRYYQQTQTPNDFLVAGPSGAGYTYPGDWPSNTLELFTSRTAQYMDRTGMDVIYALNRQGGTNIPMSDQVAQAYLVNPGLPGILYNWISQSLLSTPAGLPVMTQVGISSVSDGTKALATATQSWDGNSPLFVALGVLAWNMKPSDVVALVQSLGSQYEVVRADLFFALIRQWLGLQ